MRSVEEMQAGLRTAMNEIQSIKDDLEQFKNAKSNGDLTADFKKISANAKRYPITPHPLSDTDEHTQKLYLTLLLSVAAYEPERLSDSLNFIHRIAYGCGYLEKGDLKEEFTSAQILTFDQLDEATGLFRENDLRLMLIEEMLITAGAFNKGRNAAFEYISRTCQLLNVNKDEISFLSNMAAVVLTKDASNYKCNYLNTYPMFDVYLMDIEFPMEIYNKRIPRTLDDKEEFSSVETGLFHSRNNEYKFNSVSIEEVAANTLKYNYTYNWDVSKKTHAVQSAFEPTEKIILLNAFISDSFLYDCLKDVKNPNQSNSSFVFLSSSPYYTAKAYSVSIGVITSPLCPDNYPPAKKFFEENKIVEIAEE